MLLRFAIVILFCVSSISAQPANDANRQILDSTSGGNFASAIAEIRKLQSKDPTVFEAGNYDYLLARLSERTGDLAAAAAGYGSVVRRNSLLKEYALWHLSRIARATGSLTLERLHLEELIAFSPDSLLARPAEQRLAASWFESGSY